MVYAHFAHQCIAEYASNGHMVVCPGVAVKVDGGFLKIIVVGEIHRVYPYYLAAVGIAHAHGVTCVIEGGVVASADGDAGGMEASGHLGRDEHVRISER